METPHTWDVFCRVVDNLGDAGVCWRLARRLEQEGGAVRLWIDDLATLQRLHPAVTSAPEQIVDGVRICELNGAVSAVPAQVAIEAFGCGLPEEYTAAMETARPQTLWIVLEYLSAEPWVAAHHGLPSPHPRLNLRRYFFFPGFVEGTGGLLREPDLFARRDSFGEDERRTFWNRLGHEAPGADTRTVSFFAYETAPVSALLEAWERSPFPIAAAVPEGTVLPAVLRHYGLAALPEERVIRRGALEVRGVPFVPQSCYDKLLWSCDINFVRGEDSIVRAGWAGRPFVWQIYPQDGRAHWVKLQAFLDRYGASAPARVREAASALTFAWNEVERSGSAVGDAWAAFTDQQAQLGAHTREWARQLAQIGELADNLVSFCREKLK